MLTLRAIPDFSALLGSLMGVREVRPVDEPLTGLITDCLSLRDASLDGRQSGLRRERSR